jgi:hypothetical protein
VVTNSSTLDREEALGPHYNLHSVLGPLLAMKRRAHGSSGGKQLACGRSWGWVFCGRETVKRKGRVVEGEWGGKEVRVVSQDP